MHTNLTHLFKTRRFLPLFITQFFGAFNDNVFKNALLIWFTYSTIKHTHISPPMMVTLAAGIFILPFFLFSATAGQLADKYERTFLVKLIKTAEILLMIGCAIGFYFQSVTLLLIILFMMGTHSTFFGPIKYSLLPEHLKENELIGGNGLIEGGTFLAILLGTMFGGLVIMTTYGVLSLSIAVISFAIIGWVSSQFIPKSLIADPTLNIGKNIFAESWKMIQAAKKEKNVWLSIIGISWMWFVGSMFLMQLPTYTKLIVVGDEHVVTLFLTLFSIGIGLGSVLCNTLLKGEITGRLLPYGAMGMTICIFLFVGVSYLYLHTYSLELISAHQLLNVMAFFKLGMHSWTIIVSLFLLSVFSGIYVVPLYAIMQRQSAHANLSRMIASNNIMNAFFMVGASVLSMAFFAMNLGVLEILGVTGILNILLYWKVRKITGQFPSNSK